MPPYYHLTTEPSSVTISAMPDLYEVGEWPISRYIEPWPSGRWEYVETVKGTFAQWIGRCKELQEADPDNSYRLWDCRE